MIDLANCFCFGIRQASGSPDKLNHNLLLSLLNDRLRHTLLLRAFYCLGTLCIVTFCSKEQFPSNWLVTVCFLTHFASQELNTLCSPTHFAKSQFTPQHSLHCYLLLKRTVSFKLACYSLLLNTHYPSAHLATWNIFLLGTLYSQTPFTS